MKKNPSQLKEDLLDKTLAEALGSSGNDDGDLDEEATAAAKKAEFAKLLEASFKSPKRKLSPGDKVKTEVLVVGKEEVFVSIQGAAGAGEGIVPKRELPHTETPIKVGDLLDLYVTQVRSNEILLSSNPTAKNIAEDLEDAFDKMIPIEGKVSEVCKGGVRVAIKGKTAFCPIGQLDLAHIETADAFVGKRFEFLITEFKEGGRNIVVSRKKVLEEQKEISQGAFAEEKQIGEIVKGTVKRIEPFGAFVEVAPGVDGLVHISELSWSRVADPKEVVQIGQEIRVKILKKDSIEGRFKLSLSLKQAGLEPWQNLSGDIQEGNVVSGKVTRCMKFGAFVELAPGLEGLIPLSEMSYTKRVLKSDEFVKEGETILVKIKEIHPETKRMTLSLKDAGEDPWALAPQKYAVGSILEGKVTRREQYGLFVQLDEGVVGLLPKSKTVDRSEFPYEKLKIGDQVHVQVAELKLEERRIGLSVPNDPNAEDWRGYAPQAPSKSTFGTLGDQLMKAMSKKK